MNITKARLYKALKTNNQTRKRFKLRSEATISDATRSNKEPQGLKIKKKLLHTNSIKNHNKQFNLRNNTIKNFNA